MSNDITNNTVYDLLRPPPFVVAKEPITNPELSNTPGKLEVDESGQLLLKYLTYTGVAGDLIETYNHFFKDRIPRILESNPISLNDGSKITFLKAQHGLPIPSKMEEGEFEDLLPRQARERKETYSFRLYADVVHLETNGNIRYADYRRKMDDTGNQYQKLRDENGHEILFEVNPQTKISKRIDVGQVGLSMADKDGRDVIIEMNEYGKYLPPIVDGQGYLMQGINPQIRHNLLIGAIPAMLGSEVDHLRYNKWDAEQLLRAGECSQDPFGYFIIKGEERLILTQEKLKGNRILIYNDRDGDATCKITSTSVKGFTVVDMYQDYDLSIRVYFNFLSSKAKRIPTEEEELEDERNIMAGRKLPGGIRRKNKGKNTVCVFQVFKILGEFLRRRLPAVGQELPDLTNVTNIARFVTRFVKDEWKKKVLMVLQGSLVATINVADNYKDVYDNSTIKTKWLYEKRQLDRQKKGGIDVRAIDPTADGVWKAQTIPDILNGVAEKVFSHIDISTAKNDEELVLIIRQKINLLAIMTARFAEHLAGLRPLDDRDDWANKRLEAGGRMMEQLFRQLWDCEIGTIKASILKNVIAPTVESVATRFSDKNITDPMELAFSPNNWGPPKRPGCNTYSKQSNITDRVDRGQSIVSIYSHLMRINTPTNRRVKQSSVRGVQISQLGYADAVDTPSSEAIGLVKYKALTCWISLERDESLVMNIVNEHIWRTSTDEAQNIFMINGKPSGWCNATMVRRLLLDYRRSFIGDNTREFGFDISIIIDEGILHVYTDSSRPTRPLLIINKDNVPVIAEKNLWNANIEEVMAAGALEYLDPWELRKHATVATSIHDLTYLREDLNRNRYLLDNLESQLAEASERIETYRRPEGMTENAVQKKVTEILDGKVQQISDAEDQSDPEAMWLWTAADIRRLEEQIGRIRINITRMKKKRYTHVEMDPTAILGIAASSEPFIGNNPGPRNNFQCNMARQAIGINYANPSMQFPTTGRTLAYPSRPILGTQMQRFLGLDDLPAGQNIVMAIMTMDDNEEDAVVVKKEAIEAGLFTYTITHSSSLVIKPGIKETTIKGVTTRVSEHPVKLVRPSPGHKSSNYESIDEQGLAIPDMTVDARDCLIGAVRMTVKIEKGEEPVTTYEDISIYVNPWEGGVVDMVMASETVDGKLSINVRVRRVGQPVVGDKLATRAAQKSVIGRIIRAVDLPFTKDGIVPDIILNPHAIPKRMTVATLIEIVTSKYAAMADERINATAFRTFDLDIFREMLQRIYGYKMSGTEVMRSPLTGEVFPSEIMIGPSYYQLLKHQVMKKITARGEGPRDIRTGQPVKGRKFGGGLRFGEMELNTLIAHGATHFMRERMHTVSDQYAGVFCPNCDRITMIDAMEERAECAICESDQIKKCRIPRASLTFMNYLSVSGVKMEMKQIAQDSKIPRMRPQLPPGIAAALAPISEGEFGEEFGEGEFGEEFGEGEFSEDEFSGEEFNGDEFGEGEESDDEGWVSDDEGWVSQ